MNTPHFDLRGRPLPKPARTPESVAHSIETLLEDIRGALDAVPGSHEATGALFRARLACRLLRPMVGPEGQAAVLAMETGAGELYAKRTKEARRAAVRAEIRMACDGLQR